MFKIKQYVRIKNDSKNRPLRIQDRRLPLRKLADLALRVSTLKPATNKLNKITKIASVNIV